MTFAVDRPTLSSGKAPHVTDITIHWGGFAKSRIRMSESAVFLAKGLYHLGLLTPEVEAALEIRITAKDKANWTTELKGITTCETLDWDAEAKRIACAFDLKQDCAFEHRVMHHHKGGSLRANGEYPLFQESLRLGVHYNSYERSFMVETVSSDDPRLPAYHIMDWLANLRIGWDGSLLYPSEFEGDYLAEGLFNLGLLTPEIEAALNISVSAHQKLKWARAFKKREKRRK